MSTTQLLIALKLRRPVNTWATAVLLGGSLITESVADRTVTHTETANTGATLMTGTDTMTAIVLSATTAMRKGVATGYGRESNRDCTVDLVIFGICSVVCMYYK